MKTATTFVYVISELNSNIGLITIIYKLQERRGEMSAAGHTTLCRNWISSCLQVSKFTLKIATRSTSISYFQTQSIKVQKDGGREGSFRRTRVEMCELQSLAYELLGQKKRLEETSWARRAPSWGSRWRPARPAGETDPGPAGDSDNQKTVLSPTQNFRPSWPRCPRRLRYINEERIFQLRTEHDLLQVEHGAAISWSSIKYQLVTREAGLVQHISSL